MSSTPCRSTNCGRNLRRSPARSNRVHSFIFFSPASGTLRGSMLTLSGITKAYGGRTLFSDVTLQLNREDRVGLVGPNGAGKSTLFGIILGEEAPDDGKIMTERNVNIGYLPQESAPVGDETVIEIATA